MKTTITQLFTVSVMSLAALTSQAQVKKAPPAKVKKAPAVTKAPTTKQPAETNLSKEYTDVIYLSTTKNSYIDIKGTKPLSADIGGNAKDIIAAVQENSQILKLKAVKKFADANMLVVCKDTVLQFLLKFSETPPKNMYTYSIDQLKKDGQILASSNNGSNGPNMNGNTAINANTISETGNSTTGNTAAKSGFTPVVDGTLDRRPGATMVVYGNQDANRQPQAEQPKKISDGLPLKEDVFEKLPAKKINIQVGDLDGSVRVILDRLYTDGKNYYYHLTVLNRGSRDFAVDYVGFEVHRKGEAQSTNTDILRHEEPSNNSKVVAPSAKGRLVFATGKVELAPEEFILITLMETIGENAKEIKIKMRPVDFERADTL